MTLYLIQRAVYCNRLQTMVSHAAVLRICQVMEWKDYDLVYTNVHVHIVFKL